MSEFKDFISKQTREIFIQHHSFLEMMAAAYLKQTDIDPNNVELVEWMDANGTYHFHFQRRLETIKELKS